MAGTVVQGAGEWTGPSRQARSRQVTQDCGLPTLVSSHPHPHPLSPSSPFLSRDMAGGREVDILSGPTSLSPSSCLVLTKCLMACLVDAWRFPKGRQFESETGPLPGARDRKRITKGTCPFYSQPGNSGTHSPLPLITSKAKQSFSKIQA